MLEAGPDPPPGEEHPRLDTESVHAMISDPGNFWPGLEARPTPDREPMDLRVARRIGGGSSINGQVAVRALPEDFDRWRELGCRGWSAEEVLPLCLRLENDLDFGEREHRAPGPIPVARPDRSSWGAVDQAFERAAVELGYGRTQDHNADGAEGVTPFAVNRLHGRRVTTARAYIDPARSRPNLHVRGGAFVERLEFEGFRARGVRAVLEGQSRSIRAGEVVLCAGAIFSPAILMRSGIGPAIDLRALGIDVIADLPVGENLQEHPIISLSIPLREDARQSSRADRNSCCCARYSSGLADGGRADMFLWSMDSIGWGRTEQATGLLGASVYRSFSAGSVQLASAGPDDAPIVSLNLASDERDLTRLVDARRRLATLASHPALRAIAADPANGILMGDPEAVTPEAVRAACTGGCHLTGTCRMGAADDRGSVLDPECRVLGVDGVRVADASIMPEIVRANTHLTVVMIAERVAELMKTADQLKMAS